MSRQYAPLHTEIWNDPTFVALTSQGQRLYLLAMSQPSISWCGVVPYTARRWANLAPDTTPRQITKAVAELDAAGLVLLDEDTEELWVRSFIKYNVIQQPKLRNAASREFGRVHSSTIRAAAVAAHPWLQAKDGQPDGHDGGHRPAHDDTHSAEDENLRVGVGDESPLSEQNPLEENTNTNTPPEVLAAYKAEAERQARTWLKKDPNSIVDFDAWVARRALSLEAHYGEMGLPSTGPALRLVCSNADCREGFDLSGDEPVPCRSCNREEAAS